MKPNAIIINNRDNVAVVLADVTKGETLCLADGRQLIAIEDIPFGHKIALTEIQRGRDIIKYGEVIGQAKQDIERGGWVHAHNLVCED